MGLSDDTKRILKYNISKSAYLVLGLHQHSSKDFCEEGNGEALSELPNVVLLYQSIISTVALKFFKAFHQHVIQKSTESIVYALWNFYITMVGVLLSFIRATRTADFN